MTLSTTQDLLFDPVDSLEYNSVDVSLSENGLWAVLGTPTHGLDENELNQVDEAGACFILKRVNGFYTQKQKLVHPNRDLNIHFGSRVWMSAYGRRLFVASRDDTTVVCSGGSVFVYDLDETNDIWVFKVKLEITGGAIEDSKFGWSIMSDYFGQKLVVGAPFDPNGGILRGSGYLFSDNGGIFIQSNKFSYSGSVDNSRAGYSMAISGDGNVIFMGMTLPDLSGAVGVFKKNNSGIFPNIENSLIRDDNGLAGDYFSVAIESISTIVGNSLVVDFEGRNLYVGAHNKLDADSGIRGVVFRFNGSRDFNYSLKETILQRKGKTLDTGTLSSKFGYALATDRDGKVLIVGAKDDDETQTNSGAVYSYKKHLDIDSYAVKTKQEDVLVDEYYGNSVALSYDRSILLSSGSGLGLINDPPCAPPLLLVTLDPLNMGANMTLSNGDLTVAITADFAVEWQNVKATHYKSTGKWYWEIIFDAGSAAFMMCDLSSNLHVVNSTWAGIDVEGSGFWSNPTANCFYQFGNSLRWPMPTYVGYPVGSIIRCRMDFDTDLQEFAIDGGPWEEPNSPNDISSAMGTSFTPGITLNRSSTCQATINFGASAFAYSVPLGYQAYNIP